MLKKEFDEIKDIVVQFDSYYKYTFTYKAKFNNKDISISIGGNSEDIYRMSVSNRECHSIGQLIGNDYKAWEIHETESSIHIYPVW